MAPVTAARTRRRLGIRPARREEMATIAAFIRSTADWYRPFVAEKDMAEHEVDDAWGQRNYEIRDFYLGSVDDRPVGTISLQYFGDYAYIGYVYLDADQVGNGYGRQLLDHAARLARKRGMKGLCLIAHPEAKWATKAYRKYGFQRTATEREQVLSWNGGFLRDFYEEGFELYVLDFKG